MGGENVSWVSMGSPSDLVSSSGHFNCFLSTVAYGYIVIDTPLTTKISSPPC